MGARTDFWLYVHELRLCLENEGLTIDEQQTNILDSLAAMPPTTRREITRELRELIAELSALSSGITMRARIDSF